MDEQRKQDRRPMTGGDLESRLERTIFRAVACCAVLTFVAFLVFAGAAVAQPAFSAQDEMALTCNGFGMRDSAIAVAKDLGATVIRINLIEWRESYCDVADSAIQAVADAGLLPQLSLVGSLGYMRAKVRLHRERVSTYAIWNEPDLKAWRSKGPRAYRRLYARAYKMVKREDPGAKVLIGELSPHGVGGKTPWMAKALRKGRPLRADGIAIHPYHWFWSKRVDHRYLRALKSIKHSVRGWARARRLCSAPAQGCRPVPTYNTESAQPLWDGQRGDAKSAVRAYRYCKQLRFRQCNQYQIFPALRADHSRLGWQTGLTGFDCQPTQTYHALRRAVGQRGRSDVAWPECPQPIPGVSTPLPEGWGTSGYQPPAYGGVL